MTSSAPVQLDIFTALARRERGQRAATDHAHEAYRESLWQAIEALAASGRTFTSDDVVERVGAPPQGFSSNVRGAVFSAAAKAGLILCVGYATSRQPLGRGNLVRSWTGAR